MTIEAGQQKHRPRGAQRMVRAPGSGDIAANSVGQPIRITWPTKGRVIAVRAFGYDPESGGQTVDQASAMVGVSMQIDGERAFVTNGESGDFAPCHAITPSAAPWLELDIPVEANRPWTVTFRNTSPDTVLRGELLFTFRQD